MRIEFLPLRFDFNAENLLFFPPGKSANTLRGALGVVFRRMVCNPECAESRACPLRESCLYARIFEPVSAAGPSGLTDSPRPFVFRSRHLDGRSMEPGAPFSFGLNLFLTNSEVVKEFVRTFAEIGREGFGPQRARADLVKVSRVAFRHLPEEVLPESGEVMPVVMTLVPPEEPVPRRIRVDFLTPVELKYEHKLAETPEFHILFSRIRDRVGTLCRLYGPAPLSVDYQGIGVRSQQVRMASCQLDLSEAKRRSSRTGQTHSIGGFLGSAEYEGDLAEFLPWLDVARWTGVGRHSVWGLGELQWTPLE